MIINHIPTQSNALAYTCACVRVCAPSDWLPHCYIVIGQQPRCSPDVPQMFQAVSGSPVTSEFNHLAFGKEKKKHKEHSTTVEVMASLGHPAGSEGASGGVRPPRPGSGQGGPGWRQLAWFDFGEKLKRTHNNRVEWNMSQQQRDIQIDIQHMATAPCPWGPHGVNTDKH